MFVALLSTFKLLHVLINRVVFESNVVYCLVAFIITSVARK